MISEVLSGARRWHVECCRAEALEPQLPDGCVDLILTDPPFHKVKDLAWDREHATADAFLRWIGERLRAWRRILAPNGSLYVFASPAMAWGVEGEVRKSFSVLCNIRWAKPPHSTKAEMFVKEDLRSHFPASETIIFAEQYGSDSLALGESQYGAKCDELRGFVFEPLRAYFDAERKRSGLRSGQIQKGMFTRTGARYVFDRHTFSRSQWELPTAEQYAAARDLFNAEGNPEGAPYLREQYEALREQYGALRRPFTVSAEVPYTDVWTYPTVQSYPGKHPCEKPRAMADDIIRASSREGGLVLDLFSGSGVFASSAVALGRRAIACDMDPHWADVSRRRCDEAEVHGVAGQKTIAPLPRPPERAKATPAEGAPLQLALFAA